MQNNSALRISPPSVTNSQPNAFPVWPTLLSAIAAFLLAGGGVLAYLLVYMAWRARFDPSVLAHHGSKGTAFAGGLPLAQLLIAQLAGYAAAGAFLYVAVPRLARKSLADLGIRPPVARDLAFGIGGAVAMLFAVAGSAALVVRVTGHEDVESAMQVLRGLHQPFEIVLFSAVAVLFAPLVEEFAFRVFILNAFARYAGTAGGIAISSLLFGLAHGIGASIFIPLAVGGSVLAVVYTRSGSYASNVLAHSLFNLTTLVATFAHPKA